ncbi:unnamed protein product [Pleuronectes platessa]|uniref:Uncharacterized protein n=1 Tax=Pleuronectes platessa TaxID=8262 RepID=A0A9N7YNP0_PLEPL|nr:unnamed protein product [Pleuronectes platessa]
MHPPRLWRIALRSPETYWKILLLDSRQEIPAQGKSSSEDDLHPDEEGDIAHTGFCLLGGATIMCLYGFGRVHGMRRSCGQRKLT